jgi:hypothetical protein
MQGKYRRRLIVFFLSRATAALLLSAGCATRVRVYDTYHSDYHRWDRDEDRHYRRYLGERRMKYRDFRRLDGDGQRAYWDWRHDHR